MFTFDVCWGSLGTSIFGNSNSAANNTWFRLPSRLSFRFLWLWFYFFKTEDISQSQSLKKMNIFRITSKRLSLFIFVRLKDLINWKITKYHSIFWNFSTFIEELRKNKKRHGTFLIHNMLSKIFKIVQVTII